MLKNWPQVRASYNVAPTSQIAAFIPDLEEFSGHAMRWGLVPGWSKVFDSKYATFNARLESVADKPSYRAAWKDRRRCLIPMAGYYEWQAGGDGKQPFYITDRNVGGVVAAGLYEPWIGEQGEQYSCTMITRAADHGMDRIHGRMPVLLTPESAHEWKSVPLAQAEEFLREVETPDVVYWPVTKAVGNTRNDSAQLCEPLDGGKQGG